MNSTEPEWMQRARDAMAGLSVVLEPMIDLYVEELERLGGPSEYDWERARMIGEQLAFTGDAYQWKGSKSAGGTPPTKGQVARALACGAWCPGGLNFAGRHWEIKPVQGGDQ